MARLLQIVFGLRTGLCRSRPLFTQSLIGLQPVACAPYIFVVTGVLHEPVVVQFGERLVNLADERAAGHRADDVLREPPAEFLGDFEAHRLRAFGVERPQVHVHEAPAVLDGDLGAEAVHLVVGAVDADDLRPVDRGAEDLGPLQIGGTRMKLSSPALAAWAATLFARLPVEAQPTVRKPNSRAFDSATETTRSLNESVGKFTASFLIQSR